jgi:GT2 family glycosyltransferase/glycosyltransferase involved in cell wall biosynthesis
MTAPRLGVLVVTHRSAGVVARCLRSLTERLPEDAPIVVVDNASTDGTAGIVGRFGPRVRLVASERNLGYGAANNLGAGQAGLGAAVDWLLLVNPDVTLTHFDRDLFARDAGDPVVGQLAFATTPGGGAPLRALPSPAACAWRYSVGLLRPRWLPAWRRRAPRGGAVWASGSLCAVRRDAWEAIGGFDERFFLYFEDVDLSRRLVAAGFGVRASRAAAGRHAVGSGAGGLSDARRLGLAVSGWLCYERKWRGQRAARALAGLLGADLALLELGLRPLRGAHPVVRRKASMVRELRTVVRRERRATDGAGGWSAGAAGGDAVAARDVTGAGAGGPLRVTFVLWNGAHGGAQTHTVALADALQRRGHAVSLVLIGREGEVGAQARRRVSDVTALGLAHGREVVLHPLRFARAVRGTDPSVCVLPNTGALTVVLRCLGYRGAVVGMEHGIALNRATLGSWRRGLDLVMRGLGAPLTDCEVAVSRVAAGGLAAVPHAARVVVVGNGVDVDRYTPPAESRAGPAVVVGTAGRLVAGKGAERLVRAAACVAERLPGRFVVRVAGDGPERARLEQVAAEVRAGAHVSFEGFVADMPAFWRAVDVGVFVSPGLIEAFGLAAAEALACGCRVVAGSRGAEGEVLAGCPAVRLLQDGDVASLSAALEAEILRGRPSLEERRGAHDWVSAHLSMTDTAAGYERLFSSLARGARRG